MIMVSQCTYLFGTTYELIRIKYLVISDFGRPRFVVKTTVLCQNNIDSMRKNYRIFWKLVIKSLLLHVSKNNLSTHAWLYKTIKFYAIFFVFSQWHPHKFSVTEIYLLKKEQAHFTESTNAERKHKITKIHQQKMARFFYTLGRHWPG